MEFTALTSWINPPAAVGPITVATEDVPCSFEFASTRFSLPTKNGRYDWYATSKKTVSTPPTSATA